MHLSDFKKVFFEKLSDFYPETEVQSFYFLLTQHYLGKTRLDLALEPKYELLEEQRAQFQKALLRLKKYEPVQHILEETEFYGLRFKVSKNVLIPRPETEELVSWILEDLASEEKSIRILDIGSGSGCIPVSLAKNLNTAEVHSWDVSEEALKIAIFNAKINNVNIDFQLKDILKTEDLSIGYSTKNKQEIVASGINIEINSGELVAVIGVNGAGKSTLLKTLSGITQIIDGEIFISNNKLSKTEPDILAKDISLVLTEQMTSKNLSVIELGFMAQFLSFELNEFFRGDLLFTW